MLSKKINSKYFKICINKSFMWPHFCLMRFLTFLIPFHKYYTSYYFLADQCQLHIIPFQYMSLSVSCFDVLSAYPCSYNSDHTNNTYVFVVLETSQGFLNQDNPCVL